MPPSQASLANLTREEKVEGRVARLQSPSKAKSFAARLEQQVVLLVKVDMSPCLVTLHTYTSYLVDTALYSIVQFFCI